MFEKYIMIRDSKIICGQNNSGVWYCKELPADNIKELDSLINDVNCILNKYNIEKKKEKADMKAKGLE
jgi:hypothetical protein